MANQHSRCRICLIKIEPGIGAQNIFTLTKTGQLLSEVLSNLASVQINKDDGLPNVLCGSCEEKVTVAVDLSFLIRTSDSQLRKTVQSMGHAKAEALPGTNSVASSSAQSTKRVKTETVPIKVEPQSSIATENGREVETWEQCNQGFVIVDPSQVEPILYSCEICDKTFTKQKILEAHASTHLTFECDICFNTYNQQSDLATHKTSYHLKKFRCDFCGMYFRHKKSLSKHLCVAVPAKPFVCAFCNWRSPSKPLLQQHLMVHNPCSFCGKPYKSLTKLKRHVEHCNKFFGCQICDRKFNTVQERNGHIKKKHPNFTCNLCGKKFMKISQLNQHKLAHTRKATHSCSICNNKYYYLKTLNRHVTKCHSGEKGITVQKNNGDYLEQRGE